MKKARRRRLKNFRVIKKIQLFLQTFLEFFFLKRNVRPLKFETEKPMKNSRFRSSFEQSLRTPVREISSHNNLNQID